ncbi:MAG: hypothetical protein KJ799_05990 [Bacteroidetes bacterium]|nr:hypothetical protein [Bacteroidota bacterium]MBU2506259.1 hypothetical protein [Bacteroidota bacterium]
MQRVIKSDCKHLKTKKSFIHVINDPGSWRTNKSSTSQYWCAKTMGVTGPDDKLVEPEGCQAHRRCFVTIQF